MKHTSSSSGAVKPTYLFILRGITFYIKDQRKTVYDMH
uniref:CSON004262 protein n=1 Tax=Culicoides sonorensis TaxID=179676 RepID=A0A336MQJ4_CULSO